MNKDQKLSRLKRDGFSVKFSPFMINKYTASRNGVEYVSKNISQLFKTIYNY